MSPRDGTGRRVLVTYWTGTGSTKAVAERVGEVLRGSGALVDLVPLVELGADGGQALDTYDAFVIGAPVNGFRWRPEALDLVRRNQDLFRAKPTALFLLSVMYGQGNARARRKAMGFLKEAQDLIQPVRLGYFGGLLAAPPPAFLRLFLGIPKDAPLDARDWGAIETWAKELLPVFAS